jgi:hypothetical protein
MNEEDATTAVVEDVEIEAVQEVPAKKTAEVKTKERVKEVPKAARKEVEPEEHKDPEESQDLKWENIQRRKENSALKAQIAKLTESFDSARAEFEATRKTQESRLVRATLLSTLTKSGCIDPETAMGMLADKIKFDKHGDVENHEELVTNLKQTKSYFFTGPATSQTQATPRAATTRSGDVRNMDDAEFKKVLQGMGVKLP